MDKQARSTLSWTQTRWPLRYCHVRLDPFTPPEALLIHFRPRDCRRISASDPVFCVTPQFSIVGGKCGVNLPGTIRDEASGDKVSCHASRESQTAENEFSNSQTRPTPARKIRQSLCTTLTCCSYPELVFDGAGRGEPADVVVVCW